MSLVLLMSLGIRVAAMIWSVILLRRIRDWRMLFLTAMLALMAARQGLTLAFLPEATVVKTEELTELPGLAVSIMAFLAVVFLERMLLGQQRSEAARRRFEELLTATPDFVGISDRSGRLLYVNPAGRRLAGIGEDDDVSELSIAGLHPKTEAHRVAREKLPAAIEEGIWAGESKFHRADGSELPTSQVIVAHRDGSGNVQFLSTVARDISGIKAIQRTMQTRTRQLTAMTEAMSIYLETDSFRDAVQRLLEAALELTASEYGFMGMVAENGVLRVLAHEGMRWEDGDGRAIYEEAMRAYEERGYLEFASLDNLFGCVITEASSVIANDPASDPRAGGLPRGHPPLRRFLGVPILREGVALGMFGVANRQGEYTQRDLDHVQVLSRGAGVLLDSLRREQRARTLETERQEVRQALEETERRYERILEDLPDLISRFKPDTTITFVNEAYARCFGRRREELIGQSFLELVPEADHGPLLEHIRSLRPDSPIRTIEHRAVTADGSVRWQAWTDRGIFDESGTLVELQSLGRDITERKRTEQALRESEQRLRSVVEDQTEFIVRWRPDGTRTFVNDAYCRYFGLSREACLGTNFRSLVAVADWEMLQRKIQSLRPEAPAATDVHRAIRPDGTLAWQEWTDRGIFDESGTLVELQSVGRDITEQKRAEAALRESEERFRSIAENVPGVVYSYDYHPGQPRVARYIGPGLEEIIGPATARRVASNFDALFELIHPEDLARLSAAVRAGLEEDRPIDLECRLRHDDGTYIWVRSLSRGTKLEDGGSRWHIVLIDVTERRRIEAEEEARRERVRQMDSTIASLATAPDSEALSMEQSIQRITEAAATALRVERVGVWLLNEGSSELCCVDLFERGPARHSDGIVLRSEEYPAYFEALRSGRAVDASDARTDLRTREFREAYLEPNNIWSMLDAAVRQSGRVIGIVCHEHVGARRHWSPEEITFAGEIADQVAQVLLGEERRRADAALRESEQLYRTLVEHAPEAIVVLDVDTNRFVDANNNAERLFKLPRTALLERGPLDVSPPCQADGRDSAEAARERIDAAMSGDVPVFEWLHRDAGGRVIHTEIRLVRLPSSQGRLVRGSITDITARKESERRQKMMLNELDHRVKNNLAAVIALARHSAGSARSLQEFNEAFSGRIAAMARTHESLAGAKWEGLGLADVGRLTLGAYLHDDPPRVVLDGPDVILAPGTAMPLCMALHELATNAAKHGALSNERGCVRLEWARVDSNHVRVTWSESGGPPVSPPARAGVGTSLIEGFVSYELRGKLDVEYASDGIRCEMIIPTVG